MDTLILKVITTPILIALVSLAGRRWGSAVSEWLIGLPFTSAPIVFFLALDQGASFAASAAVAVLSGILSSIAFVLVYANLAVNLRQKWLVCLLAGYGTVLLATFLLQFFTISVVPTFIIVVAALLVSLQIIPKSQGIVEKTRYPKWDIAARMVTATLFVLAVTGFAPLLGPRLSGLITPFPVYTSIMAIFNQKSSGPLSVLKLLRGLLYGLFSFATFFLTLSIFLQKGNIALAFLFSIVAAVAVQGLTLLILNRREKILVSSDRIEHSQGSS